MRRRVRYTPTNETIAEGSLVRGNALLWALAVWAVRGYLGVPQEPSRASGFNLFHTALHGFARLCTVSHGCAKHSGASSASFNLQRTIANASTDEALATRGSSQPTIPSQSTRALAQGAVCEQIPAASSASACIVSDGKTLYRAHLARHQSRGASHSASLTAHQAYPPGIVLIHGLAPINGSTCHSLLTTHTEHCVVFVRILA